MKSRRKQLENRLGSRALARARRFFGRRDPIRAEKAGERLGATLFRVSKKHRMRAIHNLALAMPEMTDAERTALAKRVFVHFGRVFADFLSGRNSDRDHVASTTTFEGLEHLDQALAKGKGVILITGHFGNWERLAAFLTARGYELSVVARDADQGRTTEIVNTLRESTGTKVIPRGNAARPIIDRLRKNQLVGILPDQNSDEVFIPFFGKPCGTVLGPGVIAERTESPVVPCWCIWKAPGQYHIIVEAPLVPDEQGTVTGEPMMRAINRAIEAIIRRHPEQWLWFHNRWKSAIRRGLI
ncbi:MAG: Lipid A biosynthesis myristoyltransferase [Fimbriimonadaceae bacterium]|nr:Lipid A biosynthesis myristoyltransferase [Fimbriimonadaceae bacterium]